MSSERSFLFHQQHYRAKILHFLFFLMLFSDKSEAAKEAGHQQVKLLSSCSRQSRKSRNLMEDTRGARWIKSYWQGLKNAKFRYPVISACDYKPAGKPCSLHWGNPSIRMVIMPMYGNTRPLIYFQKTVLLKRYTFFA